MQDRPGFVVAVSPRARRPIRRIQDLKGANVGVSSPGSDFHLLFTHILIRHGLSPNDIQPIVVGSGAAHAAALERGIVDVGLPAGTTIPILEKRHPGLALLLDTRTAEGTRAQFGVDHLHLSVLYAKNEWLDRNPDAARKIARSIRRATEWIKSRAPAEVRAKLPQSIRTEDDVDTDAIRFTTSMLSEDGRLQSEIVKLDWGVLASFNLASQFVGRTMPDAYTNRFL
jgi:NitT/TauT family transport system substrate-binding protein